MDRHVPRRPASHAPGHVRVPHRQRGRRRGRRQPPASRHESRQRRPARADRPVSDVEALRSSTACRTRTARIRAAFPRWSCSAATSRSARPGRSSTRGSCGRCSARNHAIALGGWANPNADPERQVDYLAAANFNAEFYLTQVVSHHTLGPVRRFIETARRRGVTLPGMFGVFLSKRERADAAGLAGLFPGASGGPDARVRERRERRGCVRENGARPCRCRRAARLHQQSADRARPCGARIDSRASANLRIQGSGITNPGMVAIGDGSVRTIAAGSDGADSGWLTAGVVRRRPAPFRP